MSNTDQSYVKPSQVLDVLREHRRVWIVSTVTLTLLALVYALVKPEKWEASQALIIREEAKVDPNRAGRFTDVSEMKTTQETILELGRSKSVLHAALVEVGPPARYKKPHLWPTDRDIAELRKALKMVPPGGAEFGKTEVFYLQVESTSKSRAIVLADAVCRQLEARFRQLRDARYDSMVEELVRAESLAHADLSHATAELAELEASVGIDLADLRAMQGSGYSGGDLRQKLIEVENELRASEVERRRDEQLLELLNAAREDKGRLLASPDSLLTSQPALRRLKDGLIDAQLETARLSGALAEDHPLLMAAHASEQEIGNQLHHELAIAIRGVEVNLKTTVDRIASLERQLGKGRSRLERLAGLRATYANLVAMAENRTSMLEAARANLADARANQASARSVSLLSRIDSPDTGIYPLGPSKKMIVAAGMAIGLVIGVGLVLLIHAPQPETCEQYEPAPTILAGPKLAPVFAASGHAMPVESLSFNKALRKLNTIGAN